MEKKVVIKTLSGYIEPRSDDKCGTAIAKVVNLISNKSYNIRVDILRHTHHRLIMKLYFEDWKEYEKLKLDFLYNYGSSFAWR